MVLSAWVAVALMRSIPDGTHLADNAATLAIRPTAVVHGARSTALLYADLTTTVHTAVQTVTVC